jgi:hypothetical protein
MLDVAAVADGVVAVDVGVAVAVVAMDPSRH